MKGSRIKFALMVCGAASLIACKAKMDVGDGGGGGTVQPFAHEVDGPSISGVWQSKCVLDTWSDGYVQFDIVIDGQNIARGETKYSDSQCKVQTSTLVRNGLFRYVAKYVGDVYEVEYKFEMPNGWYMLGDNISREGSRLWISDRRVGAGAMPTIALDLISDIQ